MLSHNFKKFSVLVIQGSTLCYRAEDNYTVLHMASSEGKLEAVKLLILAGAHVNALNDDGWTPLHCACRVF